MAAGVWNPGGRYHPNRKVSLLVITVDSLNIISVDVLYSVEAGYESQEK